MIHGQSKSRVSKIVRATKRERNWKLNRMSESVEEDDGALLDAGEPETLARSKLRVRKKLRKAADFWREVLSDPVGRAEMWELLASAHTFETRFACGPNGFPQPESTWFQAGEQDYGLRLFLKWQVMDPAGTLLMLQEHDPRFENTPK